MGFTETPISETLVSLGREHGLPVVDDLGSGSFLDSAAYGLAAEPMVQASVTAGVELVTFSGDKLLGGPQAGIIVGQPEAIARLRRHPLRPRPAPGQGCAGRLRATLVHYARGEATREVPVWRMISATGPDLAARAAAWRAQLALGGVAAELRPGQSAVGGGSLPGETLPSTLLAILTPHPDRLAARLRAAARRWWPWWNPGRCCWTRARCCRSRTICSWRPWPRRPDRRNRRLVEPGNLTDRESDFRSVLDYCGVWGMIGAMGTYISRDVEPVLLDLLEQFPAVAVTGPTPRWGSRPCCSRSCPRSLPDLG